MNRNPQWPALLNEFIESRRHVPFSWGGQDCCLFAADWILLATGEDRATKWRGTYSSLLGAIRHVQKAGGVVNLPIVAGLEPVQPEFAHRGDLVGLPTSLGLALGVCLGKSCAFPGHDGLIFHSRRRARHAWRV